MSLITKVGYVRSDLESLRHWCCEQSATEQSIFSRYASERTHKWFGYHVILTKPPVITEGYQDNRVTQLGDFLLPGWHSALLAHYQPGGYMKPHCDHHVFEPSLVLVNIGRARLRVGNRFTILVMVRSFASSLTLNMNSTPFKLSVGLSSFGVFGQSTYLSKLLQLWQSEMLTCVT